VTYSTTGTKTVSLTVTGLGGSDTETKTDYITVYAAPVAAFSGSPLSGSTATTFTFTDASTGNITAWSWDFGSGASPATASTAGPHDVTYSTTGLKTVALTVTGLGGSDDETKTDYITVSSAIPAPVAQFSGTPRSAVEAPLDVTFTDESTGNITSWEWDFNNDDVVDSYVQTPDPYTYADAGRYTVKLTVTGPGGSDTETKTDYIRVIDSANTIYVDTTNGDDSNDGLSWDYPKLTIQAGIDAASDDYAVLVASGTYSGTGNVNLDFGGKEIHLKGVFGLGTTFNEGFESGIGSGWTVSPAGAWTAVTTGTTHSGTYHARSLPGSNGTYSIGRTFTVGAGGGSVTFWWKASVKSTSSYPRFVLDELEQVRGVAAANSYESKTYSLDEGSHTLRWDCVRGGTTAITAYLDDISVTNTVASDTIIDGGNTAGNRGFYFHTSETALSVVDNFTIQRCWALGGEDGGGIYCTGASPTIINSSIGGATSGNKGDYAGGIYCGAGSNLTITDCTIKRNAATAGDGGGIYCDASSPRITNCIIGVPGEANTAAGNNGGGIYCCSNSNPRITNCTIQANEADGGGGIYCDSSSPLISGCTINENLASTGGGIYLFTGSNATITNCGMSGNSVTYYGGGIYSESSTPTITGCRIGADGANTAGDLGGGISLYSSSAVITNCTIINNTALNLGGGIDCWNNSDAAITNCLIASNSVTSTASGDGNGGGIHLYEASPTLSNCTIADNAATNNGGGMDCFISTPVLNNTIVWGNIADYDASTEGLGNQIYALRSVGTDCVVTLNYSDYANGTNDVVCAGLGEEVATVTANDCITSDPAFVGGGDYHLDSTVPSPCIDAGSNALVPSGITTDIEGLPRIYNDTVDMGAYEYQPAP
jgi:parallel beta-helix repeat protein